MAFTVSHDTEDVIQANETIRYNTVLTNVGGGYMTEQDEFVCPFSGNVLHSI